MQKASKIFLHDKSGMEKFVRPSWFLAVSLSAIFLSVSALAQERSASKPLADVCQIFSFQDAKEGPRLLHARCPKGGLVLGSVTSFEAIANETLKATLVDARNGASRRVMLLIVQDDGKTLVEDLGGQIALAAGRGPTSDIEGIELDFKQFAQTGEVGVLGRQQDRGRLKADRINVGQEVALVRARRGDRPAQN